MWFYVKWSFGDRQVDIVLSNWKSEEYEKEENE